MRNTIGTLFIAAALSAAMPAPFAIAQNADATAAEVKRLLTTLAPRHRADAPQVIIVRRPVTIVVDQGPVIVDYGYTADVEVQFEFDSARLTRQARRSLAALGRALEAGELRGFDFLIAGHTDAKGSAAYNRRLSYERARAVRDFLIGNFAINPRRLHVIGWGESRLKTPRKPFAAVNRRVEVTLIVPEGAGRRHSLPPPPPPPPSDDPAAGFKSPPAAAEGQLDDFQDASPDEALTELPPCPTGRLGDPRDPMADLDDFGPRPGIDCMPPEGARVLISPEGDVSIE